MSKVALVLGGRTGLLGQALVSTLKNNQYTVYTLGREDGDILDISFLSAKIEKFNPDYIYNTIAYTQVDKAEDNRKQALLVNRSLPANIGSLIKESAIRLIHYSTDFVFAGDKKSMLTENDPTNPVNVYGKTKLDGENVILDLNLSNFCILRTSWLFGPHRSNFIATILEACEKQESVSVIHDQIGSPTFTMDLAYWSMLLAEKSVNGIFHAANSGQASWCELAWEAVSLMEKNCTVNPITSDQWPQKAQRPIFTVLDTTLLANTIDTTLRPWPQALREYIYSDIML